MWPFWRKLSYEWSLWAPGGGRHVQVKLAEQLFLGNEWGGGALVTENLKGVLASLARSAVNALRNKNRLDAMIGEEFKKTLNQNGAKNERLVN